jgi:hypothetical protein
MRRIMTNYSRSYQIVGDVEPDEFDDFKKRLAACENSRRCSANCDARSFGLVGKIPGTSGHSARKGQAGGF